MKKGKQDAIFLGVGYIFEQLGKVGKGKGKTSVVLFFFQKYAVWWPLTGCDLLRGNWLVVYREIESEKDKTRYVVKERKDCCMSLFFQGFLLNLPNHINFLHWEDLDKGYFSQIAESDKVFKLAFLWYARQV
ncbi:hypothetical protein Salat_0024800 [Sesamum alatum]|uniref:Uncharacterized protein n=1 Tax=Sesamum alatum TaxID=300844 RepID=A0AAE2CWR5_9LAMI|nr:hypothetical protein Salat_0024800 [Sesamum alatum]